MPKKARHPKKNTSHSRKHPHVSLIDNLEIYAFWTGFISTIISLAGVLVQAFK